MFFLKRKKTQTLDKEKEISKQVDPILLLNGYYELSETLRKKFDILCCSVGCNANDILSWEEFCAIFAQTTFLHNFICRDNDYSLLNLNDHCKFWSESEDFCNVYGSAHELLKNACIGGECLKENWKDFIIVS